jgi:hypothetical protein
VCVERSNTYTDTSIKLVASVIIDPRNELRVFFFVWSRNLFRLMEYGGSNSANTSDVDSEDDVVSLIATGTSSYPSTYSAHALAASLGACTIRRAKSRHSYFTDLRLGLRQ